MVTKKKGRKYIYYTTDVFGESVTIKAMRTRSLDESNWWVLYEDAWITWHGKTYHSYNKNTVDCYPFEAYECETVIKLLIRKLPVDVREGFRKALTFNLSKYGFDYEFCLE